MKRKNSFVIIVLLLVSLPACFYSDSELYKVEPIPGDPPLLSVTTNLDSLYNPQVNDSLEVVYQLEISGGDFYYMQAKVGNASVFDSDSTYGSFWVSSFLADSTGVDTLLMNYYYATNSNSLADKVGYEAQVNTLKYAIDFNMEPGK